MAIASSKTPAPKKVAAKPAKAVAVQAKAKTKEAAVTKKAAPVVVKNTPAPRKPVKDKAPPVKYVVSGEQRYRMIAEAAYFRAESRQFKSDSVRDWIEAERDIAILLGENK
ncbi:MAG: DUF2934 domain-containing protein [Candidatus Accumulibacter sp.]|jgi:hypothetical protein|nr:DUF2934 domain-containing protein [Accumulibacter sp.]